MTSVTEAIGGRLKGTTVIVGVGNTLCGDDGVGPLVVGLLRGRTSALLVDAGEVPENYVGHIAALQPDAVVVVDAVDHGGEPGSTTVVEAGGFGTVSFSTHNPSMVPFATFLRTDTSADLFAVGIQPLTMAFGAPMSRVVRRAAERLAEVLAAAAPSSGVAGPSSSSG